MSPRADKALEVPGGCLLPKSVKELWSGAGLERSLPRRIHLLPSSVRGNFIASPLNQSARIKYKLGPDFTDRLRAEGLLGGWHFSRISVSLRGNVVSRIGEAFVIVGGVGRDNLSV